MHLGIDFGTSYAKLAVRLDDKGDGRPLISSLDSAFPSVAAYVPSTGSLRFGNQALRVAEPGSLTAPFFKLALKRNPQLRLGPYHLDHLLLRFFHFLKEQLGEWDEKTVQTVTLSVPNYFGMKARRRLYTAVERAFTPQHIALLPEPVAAFLGYNYHHPRTPLRGNILIVDVGGGTTDFSFLSTQDHPHKLILETQLQMGRDAFSGLEMDWSILRNILEPAYRMETGDVLPTGVLEEKSVGPEQRYLLNRLLFAAEKLKIELSDRDVAYLDLPDLHQGHSLLLKATPDMLTTALTPVFNRLDDYLKQVLIPQAAQYGLFNKGIWDIDQILLLGGASQVRGLFQHLQSFWDGIPLHHADPATFYVAQGNCFWNPEEQLSNSVYTLYPFHFYIEKRGSVTEPRKFELLPFDTNNLELNLHGRYPIFAVAQDSDYNLKYAEDGMEVNLYESSSESDSLAVERFEGLDQVLHLETDQWDPTKLMRIYLDMARSEMTSQMAADQVSDPSGPELFHDLLKKQQDALELIAQYKGVSPALVQAFQQQLKTDLEHARKPFENHLAVSYYKLVCLVQILNPK